MDLPRSSEDENETTGRTAMSWTSKLAIAGVLLLIAAMVVLHLTGVVGGSQVHG